MCAVASEVPQGGALRADERAALVPPPSSKGNRLLVPACVDAFQAAGHLHEGGGPKWGMTRVHGGKDSTHGASAHSWSSSHVVRSRGCDIGPQVA
eukprot:1382297-Pyramimonas_sp.AAC.1